MFDLRTSRPWSNLLCITQLESHLAQKTLHNFRVQLMEHDGGRLAFCETTDRMIRLWVFVQASSALTLRSNIAVLTRWG